MHKMTNPHRQGVSSIIKLLFQRLIEQLFEHVGHLFLGSIAVPRYALFNFLGQVLHNVDVPRQRRGHSHSLRPPQFQHRLHVFSIKRSFNGHLIRQVFRNELRNPFKDPLQLQLMRTQLLQAQYPVLNDAQLRVFHFNKAISHYPRAGIYPQYNFFIYLCFQISAGLKFTLQNTVQFLSNPNLHRFFRIGLLVLLAGLLFLQVRQLDLSADFLRQLPGYIHPSWLLPGILLVLPNYYLEITKWKILGRRLENRTFSAAAQEVLRGLKLGIFTPLMAGDYLGRSIGFRQENRLSAVLLNLYNSFTQTWTALLFGSAALLLWYAREKYNFLLAPLTALSATTLLGAAFLYGIQPARLRRWGPAKKYLAAFSLPLPVKNRVLGLSVCRTVIYNFQYFCFYKAFGLNFDPAVFFIGINVLLLVKTVGGGLNAFGDLTLRELVSIYFFSRYGADERIVLIATFAVWFFSVFAPVLVSIFYSPPPRNDSSDHL